MLNINKIIMSCVLVVLCIISFVLFDYRLLNESINLIIKTIFMTLVGCYCAFGIAKNIDFNKTLASGNDTSLFCVICCVLLYSLKGCTYSITQNPFREFVFPISALFFSLLCLIKIWISPKKQSEDDF